MHIELGGGDEAVVAGWRRAGRASGKILGKGRTRIFQRIRKLLFVLVVENGGVLNLVAVITGIPCLGPQLMDARQLGGGEADPAVDGCVIVKPHPVPDIVGQLLQMIVRGGGAAD